MPSKEAQIKILELEKQKLVLMKQKAMESKPEVQEQPSPVATESQPQPTLGGVMKERLGALGKTMLPPKSASLEDIKGSVLNPTAFKTELAKTGMEGYNRTIAGLANLLRGRNHVRGFVQGKPDYNMSETLVRKQEKFLSERYVNPSESVTLNLIRNLPAEIAGYVLDNPDLAVV